MNQPLGRTAGMWCEIEESMTSLKGGGPQDLMDVIYELGSKLLVQAGVTRSETAAISIQENLIQTGKAYEKFEEMLSAQSGDISNLTNINSPQFEKIITAQSNGFIKSMDTLKIGWAAVDLGCGRRNKSDMLDPTAGIEFKAKVGDQVAIGDPIFRCFNSNQNNLNSAIKSLVDTITIDQEKVVHTLFYNP